MAGVFPASNVGYGRLKKNLVTTQKKVLCCSGVVKRVGGRGAGETDLESVQHASTAGKILRKRAGGKS